jgi:hypothetical protein
MYTIVIIKGIGMKYFKKFTLLNTLIVCIVHYATTAPVSAMVFQTPTEPMHLIKTVEDLQPFMGKIVIFESDRYYISSGSHSFKLNDLRIAFINATLQNFINNERGATMYRIIFKDGNSSRCALVPSTLTHANITMRLATKLERKNLRYAINNGQAELEYGTISQQTFEHALNQ